MDLGRKFAYLLKIMICSAILSSCTATDSTEKTPSNNKEIITATLDKTSEIQSHGQNISLTPNALINFSKDIDVDSINNNNIILQTSDGKIVPNYKLAVNKNKVVLSVPQKLQPSTKYLIIVSDKITDSSQEHTKTTTFDFTTGTTTFPTAFLISPSNIDNVSQIPNIEFDFSVPVLNVEAQNVLLKDEAGNIIETSDIISYPFLFGDLDLRFYNFFPKIVLKPDHNYTIHLSSNITDTEGNHLKETTFSFHTGNTIIPEISLKSPTPNEENISQQPTIEFNISATNSDFKNVDSDHIYLLDTAANSNQKIKLQVTKGSHGNNNFIAIVQDPNVHSLVAQRKYNIVFSDEITDSDGNHIAPTSYSFTTGSYITPTVSMLDPVNNAQNVSKTPTISFMFSGAEGRIHDVDSDNVFLVNDNNPTEDHINLTVVSGSSGVNNYIASLADPKFPLNFSTQYSIVFSQNITDDNGNHIQETRYHFTTVEKAVPTVELKSAISDVSINAPVILKFSSPMLTSSQQVEDHISLHMGSATGPKVQLSALVEGNQLYTLSPTPALNYNTTYYLVIDSSITDTDNNPFPGEQIIIKTMRMSSPTVSIIPGDDNQGDAENINGLFAVPIHIEFSRPVHSTASFFGVSSAITIYRDNPSAWDPGRIDVVEKGDNIHFDIYHRNDLDIGRSYSLKMVFGGYIVDENGLHVADTKIPLNVVRNM